MGSLVLFDSCSRLDFLLLPATMSTACVADQRQMSTSTAGFTIKAQMKNAKVIGPPTAGAFKERPSKPTSFRKFYERGDFPIALDHDTKGNRIAWKVEVEKLSTIIIYLCSLMDFARPPTRTSSSPVRACTICSNTAATRSFQSFHSSSSRSKTLSTPGADRSFVLL